MVHNNKVLTVSYGTFSCTLEGFEDSFDTMKAIAEYFRDLAADDRYFGAEPPQPDTDMLARIAEREISRQVEARRESSGIVLRAAEAPAEAQAPEVAEAPIRESARPTAPEPAVTQPAAPAPTQTEQVASEPFETAGPEVAKAPADALLPEVEVSEAAPIEMAAVDSGAETVEAPEIAAEVAPEFAPTETPAETIETAEAPLQGVVEKPAAPEFVAEEPIAEAEVMEQPATPVLPVDDSIAAKLARIRAVVSHNEEVEDEEYSEDEHAEPLSEETTDDIIHILQDEDGFEDEVPPETGAMAPQRTPTWESFAGIDEEFDEQAEEGTGEMPATAETESFASTEDEDIVEVTLEGEDSLFGDLDSGDEDDIAEAGDLENILGAEETGEETPENAGMPAARVVKIKKSDLEAAIAAGELEEIEDDEADLGQTAAQQAAALSPEDEADLMRELAEVEAAAQGEHGDLEEPSEDARAATQAGPIHREATDVDRLMEAADEKLSDPAAAARHDAYAHMRAAVATTQAEREAGGTMGTHTSDDPYRVDLAEVVRPRRPEAHQVRPSRPATESRPAPLKLVAEQRVDDGAGTAARGPVRPRRVSTQLLDETQVTTSGSSEHGFAEFAAEMGASELPDLLEAAAAYMSFVEGRDQFSRPQLMNTVRQAGSGKVNREDGLRSFGQLLREGKIEKRGGGRFAVSGDIGFRPDKRAAG